MFVANPTPQAVWHFVADARGLIRETLVFDMANKRALDLELREFAGVSETSGCAVDDNGKTLYLSEGELAFGKSTQMLNRALIKSPYFDVAIWQLSA